MDVGLERSDFMLTVVMMLAIVVMFMFRMTVVFVDVIVVMYTRFLIPFVIRNVRGIRLVTVMVTMITVSKCHRHDKQKRYTFDKPH